MTTDYVRVSSTPSICFQIYQSVRIHTEAHVSPPPPSPSKTFTQMGTQCYYLERMTLRQMKKGEEIKCVKADVRGKGAWFVKA